MEEAVKTINQLSCFVEQLQKNMEKLFLTMYQCNDLGPDQSHYT